MQKYKLVKFDFDNIPENYHKEYPFTKHGVYVMLGEIEGMDGHCIVVSRDGHTYWGYHTENFIELTEEEL